MDPGVSVLRRVTISWSPCSRPRRTESWKNLRLQRCTKCIICPCHLPFTARKRIVFIILFAGHSPNISSWLTLTLLQVHSECSWQRNRQVYYGQDSVLINTVQGANFLPFTYVLRILHGENLLVFARGYFTKVRIGFVIQQVLASWGICTMQARLGRATLPSPDCLVQNIGLQRVLHGAQRDATLHPVHEKYSNVQGSR